MNKLAALKHSNPPQSQQPVRLSHGQSSNNTNKELGSSWATTIGRYLLQRREQTQTAYQAQLDSQVVNKQDTNGQGKSVDQSQSWLFEAIFEVLVQRLDEGHTVLVLNETTNANPNFYNSDNTELLPWQQQLLQILLQPLLLQTEGLIEQSVTGMELLQQPQLWNAVLSQLTLSKYEQQILQQRYATCVSLYFCLLAITESSKLTQNSLSNFTEILAKNYLIKRYPINDNYQINNPIIFQKTSLLEDSNEALTITLWLHRTWQAEYALAHNIIRIKNQKVIELPITLNSLLNIEQQNAIHMANRSAFSIITGGPGTGKTFTVAQLVIALQQAKNEQGKENADDNFGRANLALAAPTGKAAQRMQESLQSAIEHTGTAMQLPEAKTIHRLLGIGQGGRPRYHKDNPLSEDIIIIDEASMLGVELANHLVNAIKPNARLILLGDANQLAAVDAGAVLADLCRIPKLQNVHQRLEISRRFTATSGIGQLARLINSNNDHMVDVWRLMQDDESLDFYNLMQPEVEVNNTIKNSLSDYKHQKKMHKNYDIYINKTKEILQNIKEAKYVPTTKYTAYFNELTEILNQFKILTAGHQGRCGDHSINHYLSEQHEKELKLPLSKSPWYHGRPVMILQNNYELGLFNGDIGICLQTEKGHLQVFFENKTQGIATNMLSDEMVSTAYAITIHKSQGSEFDHVAISFDDSNARLLSQELIYTAITRAKKQVSIFSTESAFTRALTTPTARQTGLSLHFE